MQCKSLKIFCCYFAAAAAAACQLELKGVPVEILVRLIPEHARKQCPFVGL